VRNDSIIRMKKRMIEVFKIAIKIGRFYYNKKANEFKLEGKTCVEDTNNCQGWPGVFIYKGSSNYLNSLELIGRSSEVDDLNNSGNFSFVVKLKENESLIFYTPSFFAEKFNFKKIKKNN
jgi:hypothetical protein